MPSKELDIEPYKAYGKDSREARLDGSIKYFKETYTTTIPIEIAKQIDKENEKTQKPKSRIIIEKNFDLKEIQTNRKLKRCFSIPIFYLDKLQQRKKETGKNINQLLLQTTPKTIEKNIGHKGKTKQKQEFDNEIERIEHETPYQGPHSMKKNIDAMIKYLKGPQKIPPMAIEKAIRNQLEVTDKRTIQQYMEEIINKLQNKHGYTIGKQITDKNLKKQLTFDFPWILEKPKRNQDPQKDQIATDGGHKEQKPDRLKFERDNKKKKIR